MSRQGPHVGQSPHERLTPAGYPQDRVAEISAMRIVQLDYIRREEPRMPEQIPRRRQEEVLEAQRLRRPACRPICRAPR